MTDDNILIEHY